MPPEHSDGLACGLAAGTARSWWGIERMATGLWLNERDYHEFAEPNYERQALLSEIATRERAGWCEPLVWLGMLPDPDPVLRKRADGVEVLEELTADDQVTMAMQNRKLKTLNLRDYRYRPGAVEGQEPTAEAKRVCDALTADLERIDVYNLISEVLDAPYYGLTVVELLWEPAGGRLKLVDAVAKPREWFGFDERNRLVFVAIDAPQGELVPPGKFVMARHFPTFKNPYGLRLLSRCLWPVSFKKGGVRFAMNYAERFGVPWTIGETRQGASDKEVTEMVTALNQMVQSAVAVIRGGGKVDVKEASGKSGDIHGALHRTWDAAISKVLMGQTLTAEVGSTGSYAASNTHYNVLGDYSEADQTLVTTFFTDLGWEYAQVNAPAGTLSPEWEFIEQEDLHQRAELDKALKECGVVWGKPHFVGVYGLSEDEFDVAPAGEPSGANGSAGAGFRAGERGLEFAGGDGEELPPEQQEIENLVDEVLPDAQRAMDGMAAKVAELVKKAETPEDLELLLAEGFPELGDELEELLGRAMLAGDMWGRWTVMQEAENEK